MVKPPRVISDAARVTAEIEATVGANALVRLLPNEVTEHLRGAIAHLGGAICEAHPDAASVLLKFAQTLEDSRREALRRAG